MKVKKSNKRKKNRPFPIKQSPDPSPNEYAPYHLPSTWMPG